MKKAVVLFTIMALVVSGVFATAFISVNDLEPEKVVETKEYEGVVFIATPDKHMTSTVGSSLKEAEKSVRGQSVSRERRVKSLPST